MFSELDEDNKIGERVIESKGRGFKIVCSDPYGYWQVFHAKNMKPASQCPGEYTSLNEAIKAIHTVPENRWPPLETRKVVLTPKFKKEEIED